MTELIVSLYTYKPSKMPETFKNNFQCLIMIMRLVKTAPNHEAFIEASKVLLEFVEKGFCTNKQYERAMSIVDKE